MSYTPPQITQAGLLLPSYLDVLNDLLDTYTTIYPSNSYLQPDTADYQLISAFAIKINDIYQAILMDYNSRSYVTAVGAGLDAVVANLGITRLPATYSTAILTVSGTAGTVILNGIAYDFNGNLWLFPASVTIGSNGTVSVLATAQQLGAISAAANTITGISTPVQGWTSVTNPAAATVGTPTESDAALRARAAISTALPSQTNFESTLAAVAAVPGVLRSIGYNNPTGGPDAYGNPAHSITMVTEGGNSLAIATAIYNSRGLGALMNGTTQVQVTDPVTGQIMTVGFYEAVLTNVYITATLYPLAGTIVPQVIQNIQDALTSYLAALQIGSLISISAIYSTIMGQAGSLANPAFVVTQVLLGTTSPPTGAADVQLGFINAPTASSANIVINIGSTP